jgi:hypothetical protein
VEVNRLEIKIVGAIADENALEEIENIARVFAYEQRMKDYTCLLPIQRQKEKTHKINRNKIGQNNRFIPNIQSHILVKGLY